MVGLHLADALCFILFDYKILQNYIKCHYILPDSYTDGNQNFFIVYTHE